MISISEGDKVKLKSGEIAKISEVLQKDKDYIAEIFKKDGHVEVDQINYKDITSVFIEIEKPLAI